jgi:hypothetical protein
MQALNCGAMLRECIKHPKYVTSMLALVLRCDRLAVAVCGCCRLHEALLIGPDGAVSKPLHDLFEVYVHDPNFEARLDAYDGCLFALMCVFALGRWRLMRSTRSLACSLRINPWFSNVLILMATPVLLLSTSSRVCENALHVSSLRCSYNELFGLYNKMLQSDNYVLKRQSLKLLSEFLLDRENFRIMMKYISDK